MGDTYDRSGDYGKAIECYQKVIGIDPQNARAWSNMGFNYYELGDLDKAIEYTRKALEIDPSEEAYKNNLDYYQEEKAAQ